MARQRPNRIRRQRDLDDQIEEEEENSTTTTRRSRAAAAEDVEEEEEEPRSPSKRRSKRTEKTDEMDVRKRKTSTKKRKPEEEEDDDTNNDENPIFFDPENFGDQPLLESDSRRLASIAEDWKQIIRYNQEIAIDAVRDIAVAMAEAGEDQDGDVAKKEFDKSDSIMRDLIGLHHELETHNDCLVELANEIARGEEIDNIIERYTVGVKERVNNWNSKTSRQKFVKDEFYNRFRQDIYEVQHPDEGMPPLTDLIPREEGDDSDDDDIAIGGVTQTYNCPLTLTILTNPLTSKKCHHSFSENAIKEYLGQNPNTKKKCPATGCNQIICLRDFKPDEDLAKRVEAHVRREQRRQAEAESDAEDVDEIID